MKKIKIFLLLLCISINIYSQDVLTTISNTSIYIPVPKGFKELIEPYKTVVTEFIPKSNKLLVYFLSEEDYNKINQENVKFFNRYIYYTIGEKTKEIFISEYMFEEIKKGIIERLPSVDMESDGVLNEIIENSKSKYNKIELNNSETTYLGVYFNNSKAMGFLLILDGEFEIGNEKIDYTVITASAIVYVKTKVINVSVCSRLNSKDDIIWVSKTLKDIVEKLLLRNIK